MIMNSVIILMTDMPLIALPIGGSRINVKLFHLFEENKSHIQSLTQLCGVQYTIMKYLVVLLSLVLCSLVAASQNERQQVLWQSLMEVGDNRNLPLLSDIYVSSPSGWIGH